MEMSIIFRFKINIKQDFYKKNIFINILGIFRMQTVSFL